MTLVAFAISGDYILRLIQIFDSVCASVYLLEVDPGGDEMGHESQHQMGQVPTPGPPLPRIPRQQPLPLRLGGLSGDSVTCTAGSQPPGLRSQR